MLLHSTTRVPVDDEYAALIGKAVYVFAYYEWSIIYIIDHLRCGFVGQYSRGKPLTSGNVRDEFHKAICDKSASFLKVTMPELQQACDEFDKLIIKRNALIHAHPMTNSDGAQILGYQTNTRKQLPDMKWTKTEVETVIAEFDAAACQAGSILERLR